MVVEDPNSRRLRGALSGAVRAGNREAEAELRHQLSVANVARAFEKNLGDQRLTAAEAHRLRQLVDLYALEETERAVKIAAIDEARRRAEAARIQEQIDKLKAKLAAAFATESVEDERVSVSA
jgi:type IV pilus biogenesis protein CpaD/CtpE